MMLKKIHRFSSVSLFILLAICSYGCKNFITTANIDEGNIEYALKVVENRNALLTADMLPETMTMNFKKSKICFTLSAFGVFSTDLISDYEAKITYANTQLMGKKYAVIARKDSLKDFLRTEPTMTIVPTSKTKKIAGYKCKHATCTFHNPDFPPFDVYYTEDIKIEEPNFYSQYNPIKGVLMEFNVYRYNVFMKLTASSEQKRHR